MTAPVCACGHHSHDHASDPTHSGNTPCGANGCPCREYQPLMLGAAVTIGSIGYGPGAWLYLAGKPVTILGVEPDGAIWYSEGHLQGAGFAEPGQFTDTPSAEVSNTGSS